MSIRDPRTQIHSGIRFISPYWEDRRRNTAEKHISLQKCFISRNDARVYKLQTVMTLICADLQSVRPVAGGPIGDPQGGDGVAGINLGLWHKPARSGHRCGWGWLLLTWGDLVTRGHIRYGILSTDLRIKTQGTQILLTFSFLSQDLTEHVFSLKKRSKRYQDLPNY